jgi:hypothetical protein
VGREGELAALHDQIVAAAAGQGRLVLVDGEPGIGKTLLVRTALAQAPGVILAGAGAELDQRLPFSTIRSCLEARAADDGQIGSVLALMARGDTEYAVVEAVLALIEDYCAETPVVLAIDDVHWADNASILLLHRLGQITRQLPLLLVAAARTGVHRPELDALIRSWRDQGAVEITLGSLPEPACADLTAGVVGGPAGPRLRSLVAGAGGNPLYLTELLTGLALAERLRQGPGDTVEVADSVASTVPVPLNLAAVVRRRLTQLTPEAQQVLQVAALIGASFTLTELSAVLAQPPSALLRYVREATDTGVLGTLPDRLAFHHPLVRTVLSEDLPPSARQALHAQIALAFADRPPPERVVEHLLAAGDGPGPLAGWLARTADDLVARVPELLVELLGPAVSGGQLAADPSADQLHATLATALLRTGCGDRSEQVARAGIARTSDARTEAALRWTIAHACISRGAVDRAVEEIAAALATGRLTRAEQARFLGLSALCQITLSRPADAAAAWQQSVTAAQASGDTLALAHGTAAAAGARIWDGWIEEALALADTSIAATEAAGQRAGTQLAPYVHRAICHSARRSAGTRS